MAQPLVALQAALPQFADSADLQMKAYKLRDLAAQAQLADQTMADDRGARAAFAANPTDGAARLSALAAVSPKAYSEEVKRQAETAKSSAQTRTAQIEAAHKSIDLAGQAFGYVRNNPTPENAMNAIKWLTDQGIYTPEQSQQYSAMVQSNPGGVKALADQAFSSALDAKSQLPKLETRDTGGEVQTLAIDPLTGAPRVTNTIAKTQTPDSIASNTRIAAEGAADRAARAREGALTRANQIKISQMVGDRQSGKGDAEASLPAATLNTLAEQALAGDNTVFQNLGRGAQGAANLIALRSKVAEKAQERGLSGSDLASINADYQGQKAGLRTSGTISARIENAAAEAAQLAPLAVDASRTVARSGFLPFGRAQVMFNNQTNDPDMNRFATANIGLATAYAGAMARGGKATVSDNEHAREMLSTAKSQKAYEAIVDQMQKEIAAAQAAPQHVRQNLRGQISGKGGSHGATTVPNPVAAPLPSGWSVQEVR